MSNPSTSELHDDQLVDHFRVENPRMSLLRILVASTMNVVKEFIKTFDTCAQSKVASAIQFAHDSIHSNPALGIYHHGFHL